MRIWFFFESGSGNMFYICFVTLDCPADVISLIASSTGPSEFLIPVEYPIAKTRVITMKMMPLARNEFPLSGFRIFAFILVIIEGRKKSGSRTISTHSWEAIRRALRRTYWRLKVLDLEIFAKCESGGNGRYA